MEQRSKKSEEDDSEATSNPSIPTPTSVSVVAPRSVYREILFLTLVSLGQDNIDLTAFDREFRRAFDKLPAKYTEEDDIVHGCDRPPVMQTLFCRKLFRELAL